MSARKPLTQEFARDDHICDASSHHHHYIIAAAELRRPPQRRVGL